MMGNKRTTLHGLTLVETLGSLVLLGVVMTGVCTVMVVFARSGRQVSDMRKHRHGGLVELMQWDFTQARQWRFSEKQIMLQGMNALSHATHMPLQQPAKVIYRIEYVGSDPWLVREQHTNDRMRIDPVCKGVNAMHYQQYDASLTTDAGELEPVPGSVDLRFSLVNELPIQITLMQGDRP